MSTLKYRLTHGDIEWIEGVLANDENSSDEELVAYFIGNGLTARQAQCVVMHSDSYLNEVIFNGDGPLWDSCQKFTRCLAPSQIYLILMEGLSNGAKCLFKRITGECK